jgi:hypothetical protein
VEYTNYSGLANSSCYFVTRGPEPVRGNTGCPPLLHRQFGVGMNVFVNGFKFRKQGAQIRKYVLGLLFCILAVGDTGTSAGPCRQFVLAELWSWYGVQKFPSVTSPISMLHLPDAGRCRQERNRLNVSAGQTVVCRMYICPLTLVGDHLLSTLEPFCPRQTSNPHSSSQLF